MRSFYFQKKSLKYFPCEKIENYLIKDELMIILIENFLKLI